MDRGTLRRYEGHFNRVIVATLGGYRSARRQTQGAGRHHSSLWKQKLGSCIPHTALGEIVACAIWIVPKGLVV